MASACSDVSPRDQAGWCLPASSDILELAIQQSPTRGGTDGTIHRDGRTRCELHAGGDFRGSKGVASSRKRWPPWNGETPRSKRASETPALTLLIVFLHSSVLTHQGISSVREAGIGFNRRCVVLRGRILMTFTMVARRPAAPA